jgi:hypothetical protein
VLQTFQETPCLFGLSGWCAENSSDCGSTIGSWLEIRPRHQSRALATSVIKHIVSKIRHAIRHTGHHVQAALLPLEIHVGDDPDTNRWTCGFLLTAGRVALSFNNDPSKATTLKFLALPNVGLATGLTKGQ